MSIEQVVKDFIRDVELRAEQGQSSQREIAQALELNARLIDHYKDIQDAIIDGNVDFDQSVTVRVDGKMIRFPSIEEVAEWITT